MADQLDFWNYPEWLPTGNNVRDGAEPFWMRPTKVEVVRVSTARNYAGDIRKPYSDKLKPKKHLGFYQGRKVYACTYNPYTDQYRLTLEDGMMTFVDVNYMIWD